MALSPLDRATISALPSATAVTRPLSETVATAGLLEVQVTDWSPWLPWAYLTSALSWRVFPTGMVSGPAGVRRTSVT